MLVLLGSAGILRGKGILRLADAPDRRTVVHQVGGRLEFSDGGPWATGEESRLVLLGLCAGLGAISAS